MFTAINHISVKNNLKKLAFIDVYTVPTSIYKFPSFTLLYALIP